MKLKFNKYVEIVFVIFCIIGTLGRHWIFPELKIGYHLLLFLFQFIGSNIIWLIFYNIDFQLNRHYPFQRNIRKRIAIQLLLSWGSVKIILIPIFYLVISYALTHFLKHPFELNKLNYISFWFLAFSLSTVIGLGFIAFHFFEFWKENEVRATQLEKEKAQVQFDNLKNQLNPHFLFNSLTSLDSLIQENPVLAREFLQQLSKIYRYLLQNTEKGLVSLETELNFIKNYASLLETRFGENLTINFHISEEYLDKKIVPATTQILVENAIKHNIINKDNLLKINILSQENELIIENNIQRKKQVETSNGQGINNLKSLYGFLTENKIVVIEENSIFSVKVPLI